VGGATARNAALIALVAECVAEGGSVLVFCGSRASCQAAAALLAQALPPRLGPALEVR
jgi:replicative superfamily II helicase